MNSFLERRARQGGRKGPVSSSTGMMPGGSGLPVFEKRVQLKDPLPGAARRGSQSPVKGGYSPVGWDHSVRTDLPLGYFPEKGTLPPKAPTPRGEKRPTRRRAYECAARRGERARAQRGGTRGVADA